MIIEIANHSFNAVFEEKKSPKNCDEFRAATPFTSKVIICAEARWIPSDEMDFDVGY